MAFTGNPTTATTVEELVNTEYIVPMIGAAAKEKMKAARFAKEIDLRGKASKVASLPKEVADFSEANVANYDLASETTDSTAEAFQTVAVAVTSAEYGIKRPVTDTAVEDNLLGMSLIDYIVESGAEDLALCADDDFCALLGSFSTTAGATTVDLSLANMAQAVIKLRANNLPSEGGAVFVLDTQQASDYDTALVAATATTLASYFTKPESANGLDAFHGTWMNCEIYSSSLCDTATAGADVAGALFLRGDDGKNPRSAAIASVVSRAVRVGYDRKESERRTDAVITQRWGCAEWQDLAGVSIITDAP